MKFANVEGERQEPQPGLTGTCPGCGQMMTAKCGQIRVPHWAHRGTRSCDHWWEPETEWHRAWKNRFPKAWQEIVHRAVDGEKHIADVKTEHGITLEFQHSFLSASERASREAFYPRMAWVVDGRRRSRDHAQFMAPLRSVRIVHHDPLIALVPPVAGALLRDWKDSQAPVYFDFGNPEPTATSDGNAILWRLCPSGTNAGTYLSPITTQEFMHAYLTPSPFDERYRKAVEQVEARAAVPQQSSPQPRPGFKPHRAGPIRRSRRL
jgi:hypothetical protein